MVCAVVALAAWRGVLRTGNRRIYFVVAAFALLAAKNLLKAVDLASGFDGGPTEELAFSVADLTAVGLIAWPLLWRRP